MAGRTAGAVNFIFDGTKEIRDLTQYALFRGVTDWANLHQFNQFESGYGMLIVLTIPNFLKALAAKSDKYQKLIDTYVHVLGSTFTMRYFEKSGSIMTKVHELFLRGVKDPTTQVKHYHGLIEDGTIKEPGFDQEVFSFLYIVTDNTLMNVEKAFYIVAAQPTNADLNIYNIERGDIGFKELSVEFSGFPITNTIINQKAQSLLDWVRKGTIWDESEMTYSGVTHMKPYSNILTPNGEGNTGKGVSYTG